MFGLVTHVGLLFYWTDFCCSQLLPSSVGVMSDALQQVQNRNQQYPGSAQVRFTSTIIGNFLFLVDCESDFFLQDIKTEANAVLSSRSSVPDGSLIGVSGCNFHILN